MRFRKHAALATAALFTAACGSEPVSPESGAASQGLSANWYVVNVDCPSTLPLGSSAFCTAWVDEGGYQSILLDAEWSSSAPGVVSVDPWGTITAHSYGIATIQATHGGNTGFANVHVPKPTEPDPPLTVTIEGPNEVGTNQECGFWANTNTSSSATYTWHVTGATGFSHFDIWQGSSSGSSFTLSVTAASGGQTASDSKTVTVTPGYLALCQTLSK